MRNDIKFVYFDVGGVIFRWREVLIEIAKRYKKPVKEIGDVFAKYDLISCRGELTPKELWEKMCQELGISAEKDFDFLYLLIKTFNPIIETHQFIEETVKHLPVGLLTNIYPGVYRHLIKYKHIPNLEYSVVIQSCDLGTVKPEKEIYDHAQKRARVKPENILLVDDTEVNIRGAEILGWSAILFETDNPKKSIQKIRNMIGLLRN